MVSARARHGKTQGFCIGIGLAALLTAVLWGFLLCGCSVGRVDQVVTPIVPAAVSRRAQPLTLSWAPWDAGDRTNQVHIVVGKSVDLQSWTVITNLPCCATSLVVSAAERVAFYRVGYGWGFWRPGLNWE